MRRCCQRTTSSWRVWRKVGVLGARGGQEGTGDLLRLGSPSSSFPHADLYSELDYEPDISDNCSSSSSSPLKESTFSKLAVQVCLCVIAVSGDMVVRGTMESVAPVRCSTPVGRARGQTPGKGMLFHFYQPMQTITRELKW